MSWARGQDAVRRLVAEGRLETVTGGAADGTHWLESAAALLESADREIASNPEAAYVLAYDAARKACTALLAQQGPRTKTAGHQVTVEQVARAQFGGPFNSFAALRRRRSEVEYPQRAGNEVDTAEAEDAVATAREILSAADGVITQLTLFR